LAQAFSSNLGSSTSNCFPCHIMSFTVLSPLLATLIVVGEAAPCRANHEDDILVGNGCGSIQDDGLSLLQYSTKSVQPAVEELPLERHAAPAEEAAPAELQLSKIPKFVISTARYGKRTVPLVEELRKYGDAFSNTCRVQAVVGSQCKQFWHGDLELGAASVSTSHMKIWQHMVDKQIPVAMGIEDDVFGLTPHNFISLLQQALDRYKNYDIFRIAQTPVPAREQLEQQPFHVNLVQHQEGGCRGFWGQGLYIMTLAGAKFALANFKYGTCEHSLDVYYDAYNYSAYSNLDSYKIECFKEGIMRFYDDQGDWRSDEAKASSERLNPDSITNIDTNILNDWDLIQEVLPECPMEGILMEPCANFRHGRWTTSEKA